MVTFVCSNCNSSLKKSQVQIHGCNAKFACITCNNDFSKATSKTHDSCISEAEKYQGSDYRSKTNKGEARQGNWIKIVNDALNEYETTDVKLRNVINCVKSKPNIPQKEKPFINFIKSISASKQVVNCSQIIWGIISNCKDKMKVEQVPTVLIKVSTADNNVNEGDVKIKKRKNEENNETIDNEPIKKKSKLNETEEKEVIETKRKNKTKKTNEIDSLINNENEIKTNGEEIVKTEEKKKKKKSKVEEVVKEEEACEKKDKKKKKKNKDSIVNEVATVEGDCKIKKKKVKEVVLEEKTPQIEEVCEKKDKKKKKKNNEKNIDEVTAGVEEENKKKKKKVKKMVE